MHFQIIPHYVILEILNLTLKREVMENVIMLVYLDKYFTFCNSLKKIVN